MNGPARSPDRIEAQAAAWLARRDGGLDTASQAELDHWLSADPRHAAAFAAIDSAWRRTEGPPSAAVRAALQARVRRRRSITGAACAVAILAVASVWLIHPRPDGSTQTPALAQATAREITPQRQTLPDGTIVTLQKGAHLDLRFDSAVRRVQLRGGDALFAVAKDRVHPFLVDAAGVEVRAVGTAFVVSLAPAGVEVLVTEGRVAVARGNLASPAFVPAGCRLQVPFGPDAAGLSTVVPASADEVRSRLAWTAPRLEFTDTTLAEAATLFNRHNRLQVRTGDAHAAGLRVTGVFREDNIEGFVSLLEAGMGIRAERLPTGEVVLRTENP